MGKKDKAAKLFGTKSTGVDPQAVLTVGSRVLVAHSVDTSLPKDKWPVRQGVVIDDFGATVGDGVEHGRNWAISKRWAIALDDGNLVFRDTADVQLAAPQ